VNARAESVSLRDSLRRAENAAAYNHERAVTAEREVQNLNRRLHEACGDIEMAMKLGDLTNCHECAKIIRHEYEDDDGNEVCEDHTPEECGACHGSGGGPDAALKCRSCGGKG